MLTMSWRNHTIENHFNKFNKILKRPYGTFGAPSNLKIYFRFKLRPLGGGGKARHRWYRAKYFEHFMRKISRATDCDKPPSSPLPYILSKSILITPTTIKEIIMYRVLKRVLNIF